MRLTWDQPNYNRFNHLHEGDYTGDLGDVLASEEGSEEEGEEEEGEEGEEEEGSDIVIEFSGDEGVK